MAEYQVSVRNGAFVHTTMTLQAGSVAVAVKRALDGWVPSMGTAATSGPGFRGKLRKGESYIILVSRVR